MAFSAAGLALAALLLAAPTTAHLKADAAQGVYGAANTADPVRDLQRRAARRDPSAMQALSWKYRDGVGVPADTTRAVYWMRKAAGMRHVPSMLDYSLMHMRGIGLPQDRREGYRWRERAYEAALGRGRVSPRVVEAFSGPEALRYWCAHVVDTGAIYLDIEFRSCSGEDAALTSVASRAPYEAAAGAGSAWAMQALAVMAARGYAGPADPARARAWCEAATARMAEQRRLIYGEGPGGPAPITPSCGLTP